ncbi:YfhH family protein [Alicyclobacillus tolerans]|uniref:DUF1811 family protein n=1 Tax=Alicyclobacillus tolerans TaxID=90970 RepID=UPI001F1ABF06|nr:DUF1811 family protein [Alicyclobacillus tolerans]MCF8565259.1 YfhH family protein [Alicyclobacillus tolerans]
MALYSDMTPDELQRELDKLRDQGQAAYDNENWQEYEVLMTKWYLAKSYQIKPAAHIEIGRTYRLAEEYDQFTVTDVRGVMAWGTLASNAQQKAVPIAMLATD